MKKILFFLVTSTFWVSTIEAQNSDNPILDYINLLETDVNDLNHTFYLNTYDSGVDSLGNLVVIGDFNGSIDLDPSSNNTIITANPIPPGGDHPFRRRSSFIAKYDAQGSFIWGYKLGEDTNFVYAYDVKIDHNDNIAIAGLYKYDVDFDLYDSQHILSSPSLFKTFVVSYNPNGVLNWVNQIDTGSNSYSLPFDIDVKSNGNVVVAGEFNGQLIFSGPAFPITLNNSGSVNSFFAEVNTSGTWIAARHIQSSNTFKLESIVIDSNNNIICNIRETQGTSLLSRSILKYTNFSIVPITVLKLQPGNNTSLVIGAMAIDDQDNLYVGGYFKGTIIKNNSVFLTSSDLIDHDAYLLKLNSQNTINWTRTIIPIQDAPYTQYLTIGNIEVDNNDRLIIHGSIKGTYKIVDDLWVLAKDPSIYNQYIAKFNQQGSPSWASIFQGYSNTNSLGRATVKLSNDQFFVYGTLRTKTDFDFNSGVNNVTPVYNDPDPFIAKYDDVTTFSLKKTKPSENPISIYPTHVKDHIAINNTSNNSNISTLRVYNILGLLRMEYPLDLKRKEQAINMNILGSGIYIIKIFDAQNKVVHTEKVIKY